jgi:putative redox protein
MPAERFDFPNAKGEKLAAILDLPDGTPRATALFARSPAEKRGGGRTRCAHGVRNCGALRLHRHRIERRRVRQYHLLVNIADLVAADLRSTRQAPALSRPQPWRRGRSAAAGDSGEAVVTIAAPSGDHIIHLFRTSSMPSVSGRGRGCPRRRTFRIRSS